MVQAVTVFERDDDGITVVASGGGTISEGIGLLHRAILQMAEMGEEDHGSDS